MSSKNIDPFELAVTIGDILRDFEDEVYKATEEGLTRAEKILIKNLKLKSPKESGGYAKGWRSKGKKYKMRRFVGNTKTVKGKKGEDIPLANILEYSEKSPHQSHIKIIFEESLNQMVDAVKKEIEEGV